MGAAPNFHAGLRVRALGIGLVALAALFAWLFIWRPIEAGNTANLGIVGTKVFVFVPLGALVGLSLLVGGPVALRAFQPPFTRARTVFVLVVLGAATALTLAGYFWYREQRILMTGEGATNAVLAFYRERASMAFQGFPDDAQLARLAPHLAGELVDALRAARVAQMRCEDVSAGDAPRWSQGDLFTSHFEGHTLLGVRQVGPGQFALHFDYFRDGERASWQDLAVMGREDGHWVSQDVLFGPPGAPPRDRPPRGIHRREGLPSSIHTESQ